MRSEQHDTTFQPHRWQHNPITPRGDGRGLGKPIRIPGRGWVGQSRCDIINGKPVFRKVYANGAESEVTK